MGVQTRAGVGWRTSHGRRVEVGENVKERSRPGERKERTCVMEEGRSAVGAAHLTPLSQMDATLQRESALRKAGEQVVL